MNSVGRIKKYIEDDEVYQRWKLGVLDNPSDFEKYCIDNCMAMENLIIENIQLKEKIKKIVKIIDEQILDGNLITYQDFAKKLKDVIE